GHGAAALSGLTGFLVLTSLLSVGSVADLSGIDKSSVDEAFKDIDENVFMGIFSGIISSIMYNRFSDTKLPDALAFFSGKRLAPILSARALVAGAAVCFSYGRWFIRGLYRSVQQSVAWEQPVPDYTVSLTVC